MTAKPDRMTAMRNIIDQVKAELPIYEPETFVWAGGAVHRLSEEVTGNGGFRAELLGIGYGARHCSAIR